MKHFFIICTCLVAAALGAGPVAAQDGTDTPTPTPTISADSPADEILELARGVDPANVSESTIRDVRSWVTEPSNLRKLDPSEASAVLDWLRDASETGVNISIPTGLSQLADGGNATATSGRSKTSTSSATSGRSKTSTSSATSGRSSTITATATEAPTPTGTATETATPSQTGNTSQPIGPVTTVEEWTYNQQTSTMRLLIKTSVPTRVTLSGAPDVGRGVGRYTVTAVNTGVGKKWVSINVEKNQGAAVVFLSTPQCVASGACGYVSTNEQGADPFKNGNPTWGWIGGALLSMGAFVLAGAWVLRNEGTQPEVA